MPATNANGRSESDSKLASSAGVLSMQARRRVGRVPLEQALGEAEEAVLAELQPIRRCLTEAMTAQEADGAVERAHLDGRARRSVVEDMVLALVSRGGANSEETRHAMALLEVLECADRMMAQCVSIAAMRSLMRRDAGSIPEMLTCLSAMGEVADQQIAAAERVFATRALDGLTSLRNRDRKLCELQRRCLAMAGSGSVSNGSRNGGNLATLIARAIERIGEEAVGIGRQAAFLVTGVAPPMLEADAART